MLYTGTGANLLDFQWCFLGIVSSAVSEFIDLVFAKTSPKRSFGMTENERFGLVFAKTWYINSELMS